MIMIRDFIKEVLYRATAPNGQSVEVDAKDTREAGDLAAQEIGGGIDPFTIDVQKIDQAGSHDITDGFYHPADIKMPVDFLFPGPAGPHAPADQLYDMLKYDKTLESTWDDEWLDVIKKLQKWYSMSSNANPGPDGWDPMIKDLWRMGGRIRDLNASQPDDPGSTAARDNDAEYDVRRDSFDELLGDIMDLGYK